VIAAKSLGIPSLRVTAIAAASIGFLVEYFMSSMTAIFIAVQAYNTALIHSAIDALNNYINLQLLVSP
jgi:hypothetical protein